MVAVKQASCAVGEETLMLPDGVKAGDIIECHGVTQRVTYSFESYALERVSPTGVSGHTGKQLFTTGLWGTVITTLCCVTPALPWALGVIGLAMLVPYLDYALLPLLAVFLTMTVWGWRRTRHRRQGKG